jgi:hypothetical protein
LSCESEPVLKAYIHGLPVVSGSLSCQLISELCSRIKIWNNMQENMQNMEEIMQQYAVK